MKKSEVAKLVAMLVEAFPSAQVSPATSEIYERMLDDLDASLASAAVENLIKTSRFFPTIAEIREAALKQLHGPATLGAEAWGEVVKACQRVGHYRPMPTFEDPLIAPCIRALGGWQYVCKSENDVADRSQFIRAYEGMQERGRKEAVVSSGLRLPAVAVRRIGAGS